MFAKNQFVHFEQIIEVYFKYILAGLGYVYFFKLLLWSGDWLIDGLRYGIFLSVFFGFYFFAADRISNVLIRQSVVYFIAGLVGVFFVNLINESDDNSPMILMYNFMYCAGLVTFSQIVWKKNSGQDFDLSPAVWFLIVGCAMVSVNGLFYFILHSQLFWRVVTMFLVVAWQVLCWREFFILRQEQKEEMIREEIKQRKIKDDELIINLDNEIEIDDDYDDAEESK